LTTVEMLLILFYENMFLCEQIDFGRNRIVSVSQ